MARSVVVSISAVTTKFEQGLERVSGSIKRLKQTLGTGSFIGQTTKLFLGGGGALAGLYALDRVYEKISESVNESAKNFEYSGDKFDYMRDGFARAIPLFGKVYGWLVDIGIGAKNAGKSFEGVAESIKLMASFRSIAEFAGLNKDDAELFKFDQETLNTIDAMLSEQRNARSRGVAGAATNIQRSAELYGANRLAARQGIVDEQIRRRNEELQRAADEQAEIEQNHLKRRLDWEKKINDRRSENEEYYNKLVGYQKTKDQDLRRAGDEVRESLKPASQRAYEAAVRRISELDDLLLEGELSESEFGKAARNVAKSLGGGNSFAGSPRGLQFGSSDTASFLANFTNRANASKSTDVSDKIIETARNTGASADELKRLNRAFGKIGIAGLN